MMAERIKMSHEVETMAWANKVPWHRLGRRVEDNLTPDQILRVADLDWQVDLKSVGWIDSDANDQYSNKFFSLIREKHTRIDGEKIPEQLLATGLTNQYKPIQNERMAQFFKEYIDNGVATMETAISLFNGQIVILMAKTNESFELAGGDKIEQYLYCANYHTGRNQLRIRSSNTRVVCNNTFTASLHSGSLIQKLISHRVEFTNEIEKQVKFDLGISVKQMSKFKEHRVCEKCSNKFLFANLYHSHIEGLLNPILPNEEEVQGYYCWNCAETFKEKANA